MTDRPRRPRVIFVNRFFHPDLSATSQMLGGVARGLASRDIDVQVVCSRQLYDGGDRNLAARETCDDVGVHRVATTGFGRSSTAGRLLDYLSFHVAAALRVLAIARPGDVIVAKTDPPLLSVSLSLVVRLRRARLVNWLQDVFPEVAMRIDFGSMPAWLARALVALRDASLRHARMNVVLGGRMHEHLASRGLPDCAIRVIPNWADGAEITPRASRLSALRRRLRLEDCFVAGYSGNLGRSHDVEAIIGCAELLRHDAAFTFLMVGGGVGMEQLRRRAAERGLTNLRFEPYQAAEHLADSLAAADVHLVSLLPELEGLVVPSKIYGILAAGRPVVFIGTADGDVGRLVTQSGCGTVVAPGDGAALARALQRVRADPLLRDQQEANARRVFDERYSMTKAVAAWQDLLDGMLEGAPDAQAASSLSPERTPPGREAPSRRTV